MKLTTFLLRIIDIWICLFGLLYRARSFEFARFFWFRRAVSVRKTHFQKGLFLCPALLWAIGFDSESDSSLPYAPPWGRKATLSSTAKALFKRYIFDDLNITERKKKEKLLSGSSGDIENYKKTFKFIAQFLGLKYSLQLLRPTKCKRNRVPIHLLFTCHPETVV